MWTSLQLMFAGAGSFIFHWGTGVALLILCAVIYFASASIPVIGPWLGKFREQILWVAAAIAVFMAGQAIGARDASNRCEAKQIIVERVVTKVVDSAKKSTTKDKWNSPEN